MVVVVVHVQHGIAVFALINLLHFGLVGLSTQERVQKVELARLLVAAVDLWLVRHFAHQVIVACLGQRHVSLGVVSEEKILVRGVLLNPLSVLAVVEQAVLNSGTVVFAITAEQNLLEVCVVENVGIHDPA